MNFQIWGAIHAWIHKSWDRLKIWEIQNTQWWGFLFYTRQSPIIVASHLEHEYINGTIRASPNRNMSSPLDKKMGLEDQYVEGEIICHLI